MAAFYAIGSVGCGVWGLGWWVMFDWKAELEVASCRVADLEEKVRSLQEQLQRNAVAPAPATPIERILDRDRRILSIRMAELDRAKIHERFIQGRISSGAKAATPVPYRQLAQVCFDAAKSMPEDAAKSMRTHASAFYAKAIAREKTPLG
jgi:hypothetical protein